MRSVLLVLAAVALAVGCSDLDKPKPAPAAISAERLGTPSPSMLRYLNDDEREALDRAGIGSRAGDDAAAADDAAADLDAPPDEDDSASDKAGRMGISLLSVGVTLGAIAAPFFLF